MKTSKARRAAALLLLLSLNGCALTPKGLGDERRALDREGAGLLLEASEAADAEAALASLPRPASGDDWRGLLRRTLLANGELHAAWYEWKASVERVKGASAWPNSNLMLGYSYAFSDESMKSFDRMSFDVGFDSMENLSFPGKAMASGRAALAEARANGEKFRAAKFSLQRKLLDAWLDLVLAAENERLADEEKGLASLTESAALVSVGTGGAQTEATSAAIAAARSEDRSSKAGASVAGATAKLAAIAVLPAGERLPAPTRLPQPRPLPADADILVEASRHAPAATTMDAESRGREEEEALAKLQWIPDINPFASFMGGAEQLVGAAIVLPTAFVKIRSAIESTKALRSAAAAKAAQARREERGEVLATLVAARDAERARRFLEERLLPAARLAGDASRSAYGSGQATLAELIEARALLVEIRREIAETAVERERQLAALEETLGADLESFDDGTLRLGAEHGAQRRMEQAGAERPTSKEQSR